MKRINFFYSENSGKKKLIIKKDLFLHIIKSRRKKINEIVLLRNLKDNTNYFYKIIEIDKKKATLLLENIKIEKKIKAKRFHLGICVINPKSIKEVLPYLNQINLKKITFIYSDLSQKNFNLKKEKIKKILLSSSEQSSRNTLMDIDFKHSVDDFLKENKDSYILNFGGEKIDNFKKDKIKTCIVGPEGGFSKREEMLFKKNRIISFDCNTILKTETAAVALCSKILL